MTETEQAVADIWVSLLSCGQAGPEDDFIRLGGDSVTMMMALFQVQERFKVELPPEVLLRAPVLRDFCALVDDARRQALGERHDQS